MNSRMNPVGKEKPKVVVATPNMVPSEIPELKQITEWLAAGCPIAPLEPVVIPKPNIDQVMVSVFLETIGEKAPAAKSHVPWPSINWQPVPVTVSHRNGNWPKALKKWATVGLTEPDSVGTVIHELAKWLYWIEMYEIPASKRKAGIIGLLTKFVNEKHNGFITRINTGNNNGVRLQVARCVDSAIRLQSQNTAYSELVFSEIRQKRNNGIYTSPLNIVAILSSNEDTNKEISSVSSSSLSIYIMCRRFAPETLPKDVLDAIKKHAGRKRIMPFAAKLISYLFLKGGSAFVGQDTFFGILGYKDPPQLQRYLTVLEAAHVIARGDSYKVGRNGKSCTLSDWVIEALKRSESQ